MEELMLSPEPTDTLAIFRQQVAEEDAQPKKGMSDKALEKLRAINAADKADKIATEKFLSDFKRLPKDTFTLTQLLKRILRTDQTAQTVKVEWEGDTAIVTSVPKNPTYSAPALERMANKLISSLQHGWFPTSVGDVLFLSGLTPDEVLLSEDKFYRALEANAASNPIFINGKTPKDLPLSTFDGREIPLTGLSHENRARVSEIGFDKWLDEACGIVPKPKATIKTAKKVWWTAERCRKNGLCKAGSLCVKAVKGKPAPEQRANNPVGTSVGKRTPSGYGTRRRAKLAN